MYPWMVDTNPQLADLVIRIMKHSIASLYESTPITKERPTGFFSQRLATVLQVFNPPLLASPI
jgi:THO complex subunit 2